MYLTSNFWNEFVTSGSYRTPQLIATPFRTPLVTDEEALSLLHAAAEVDRLTANGNLALYLDSGRLYSDYEHYLPYADDLTPASYRARVDRLRGDKSITIAITACHSFNVELFDRVRSFIRPFLDLTGIPEGGIDTDLFTGSYAATPTGIHRDASSNFSFVIQGRKTYLFWPLEALGGPRYDARGLASLRTSDWTPYADSAMRITAEPGDIIYWPVGHWHVAVSDGEWASTMNVALFFDRSAEQRLLEILRREVRASRPEPSVGDVLSIRDRANPASDDPYAGATSRLVQQLGSAEFKTAMTHRWLSQVSAAGFETLPPMQESSLDASRTLRLKRDFPVVTVLQQNELLLSVNGHVVTIDRHRAVTFVVDRLNTGATFDAAKLIADALAVPGDDDVEVDEDVLLDLLRFFDAAHAFQA